MKLDLSGREMVGDERGGGKKHHNLERRNGEGSHGPQDSGPRQTLLSREGVSVSVVG